MGMQLIETIELGSSASTVTFSAIPQDYTDLLIKTSIRSTRTGANQDLLLLNPNGSSGSFSYVVLFGSGSTVTSASGTTNAIGYAPTADTTSNTFGNADIYISNYTTTGDIGLSIDGVTENNATDARQFIFAAQSTAGTAISSIELDLNTADFATNSTFSLYGIS